MKYTAHIILCLGLLVPLTSAAQMSPEVEKFDSLNHSAKWAAWQSTMLPGLGQAYNHRYWKIPLIYAALGTTTFFIIDNNKQYQLYKQTYFDRQNGDTLNDPFPQYSDDNLLTLADYHHRNRDFSFILTVLVYAINIIDASVDAHLFGFDVSDDLSMQFRPSFYTDPRLGYVTGLSLTLKL